MLLASHNNFTNVRPFDKASLLFVVTLFWGDSEFKRFIVQIQFVRYSRLHSPKNIKSLQCLKWFIHLIYYTQKKIDKEIGEILRRSKS